MKYENTLTPISSPSPILSDFPRFVEPLVSDDRFLAPPVVGEKGGKLIVRAWRYWYNVRGIVETENRLDPSATAVIVVHPWGVDDGHGLTTPAPAGIAFFCTPEKNAFGLDHMREVLNPFLLRMRPAVALVGYSLPGVEDPIRRLLYASVGTKPEELNREEGERRLAALMARHGFTGQPLIDQLTLSSENPTASYMTQTPSTDAGDRYCGAGFWQLPMPIAKPIDVKPRDIVFYDAEGYGKVRDFLKARGIRHILLAGYCTDMCVISTTCGYQNLSKDFNVFLVGDATLATFPASATPRYATQVALANAALTQLVTQTSWIREG